LHVAGGFGFISCGLGVQVSERNWIPLDIRWIIATFIDSFQMPPVFARRLSILRGDIDECLYVDRDARLN
jgi:hypothetical protein